MLLLFAAASAIVAGSSRNEVVEGNPAGRVRVLIYEDLQGADCARFRTLLDDKIIPRYGSRVSFVHRDFPLGKHDWARPAAIAARWVYEQDPKLGITIRQELMAEHDHITPQNLKPWLVEFAGRYDLDPKGMLAALDDPRLGALVDQDRHAGMARDVTSAPTLFVAGQTFTETIVYDDLARVLDEALK